MEYGTQIKTDALGRKFRELKYEVETLKSLANDELVLISTKKQCTNLYFLPKR
jgi:hypothetical protein